jgi:hypothetical protein
LSKVKSYGSSLTGIFERLCQLQTKVSAPPVQRLPIRFFTSRRTALDRKLDGIFLMIIWVYSVIVTLNFLKSGLIRDSTHRADEYEYTKDFVRYGQIGKLTKFRFRSKGFSPGVGDRQVYSP